MQYSTYAKAAWRCRVYTVRIARFAAGLVDAAAASVAVLASDACTSLASSGANVQKKER